MSKHNANVQVKQPRHRFEKDGVYAPFVPHHATDLFLESIDYYYVVATD
jgi:hypothetical protein